ncbi:MAG: hypothetical protein JNM63_18765 [Spirochaetia bacterium]|nr:hypothetical protein [Spirochaetia bacterium]
MAAKGSDKEIVLVLEGIRTENILGKFVDDEFLKRNFAHLTFENERSLSDVLKDLALDGKLLKFSYGDRTLYVLNNRYPVEEVFLKQAADEVQHVINEVAHTRDENQRRRLLLKQSLIKQIYESLEQHLTTLSKMDEGTADRIIKENARTRDALFSLIAESTRKFRNSFNVKDVTSSDSIKRIKLTFSDKSLSQLMEILEAMDFQKKIIIVPMPNREKLFLDFSQLDEAFMAQLERERNSARDTSHKEETGGGKDKHHLKGLDRYMLFDNIYKIAEPLRHQIYATQKKAQEAQAEAAPEKQGEAPTAQAAVADKLPTRAPKSSILEPVQINPESLDDDAYERIFIEDMPDEKLDEEFLGLLDYNQSRELLRDYLKNVREAADQKDKIIHFRTFFSCTSMLVRIPSENSKRIYEIARVYLERLGGTLPQMVRDEEAQRLEESLAALKNSIKEEILFSQYAAFN